MIAVQSIDMRGLERLIGDVQGALLAAGEDGDAAQLVKQTGKLLAQDIGRSLSPKSQADQNRRIESDIRSVFRPMPPHIFPEENRGGDSGTTWLYAGPNYIVGVANEDFFPDAQESAVTRLLHTEKRGKAWSSPGYRRNSIQHTWILDRIVIKRQQYNALRQRVKGRVGRLKASFFKTFERLGGKGVPGWISKHFGSIDNISTCHDEGLKSRDFPTLEFGSSAPGISRFVEVVHNAVEVRKHKMVERLKLILSGYARDVSHRIRPRKHAHDFGDN